MINLWIGVFIQPIVLFLAQIGDANQVFSIVMTEIAKHNAFGVKMGLGNNQRERLPMGMKNKARSD